MKRFFRTAALVCALAMLFTAPGYADGIAGTCGDGVSWSFDITSGVLEIKGTGAMKDYSHKNSPWYSNRSYIKTVTVGEGVTYIGENAFFMCNRLESVTLPSTLKIIGDGAFDMCTSLSNITLPASLEEIHEYAFASCINLKNIDIPNTVQVIKNHAFTMCVSIGKVNIPQGITEIADYAFAECEGLIDITLPDTVTVIGNGAFCKCKNLLDIFFVGDVKEIGREAFYGCEKLEDITIPTSVSRIGNAAFEACTNLKTIVYGGSIIEWNRIEVGEENDILENPDIINFGRLNGLAVKAYVDKKANKNSLSNDLKFISSVDGTDYRSVGFYITMNDKKYKYETISVYEKLSLPGGTTLWDISATDFSVFSKYLFAYTLTVEKDHIKKPITVQAYLERFDGTVVKGDEQTFTMLEVLEAR